MKGKMLIVLASLALVFGMLIASCDSGLYPNDPHKDGANPNKFVLDLKQEKIPIDGGSPVSIQAVAKAGVKYLNPWESGKDGNGNPKPVADLSYADKSTSLGDLITWITIGGVGDGLRLDSSGVYVEVFDRTGLTTP